METLHKILAIGLLCFTLCPLQAQETFSLQQCREKALKANYDIRISAEKVKETDALKKMALSQFFPSISANGAYMYNSRNISILSASQQNAINTFGTQAMEKLSPVLSGLAQGLMQADPALAVAVYEHLPELDIEEELNSLGRSVTEAANVNLQNIFAGSVTLTQPVFTGGRIAAMHKAAGYAAKISGLQYDKQKEDILVAVDKAYWQVVSVQNKQQLARQYRDLLLKLDGDMALLLKQGIVTQSDALKVHIKLNEAQMSLTKADNGLALCKMLLCQLCGMDLQTDFTLEDEDLTGPFRQPDTINMEEVWAARPEIRMLEYSDKMAKSGVQVAASSLMPNLMLTASYLNTNPNLFDGFRNKFGGLFTVGAMLSIPICQPGRAYAVQAAKHKRNEVQYQMHDAKEKIQLQVNQLNFALEVAEKRLGQAQLNLESAEENLRLADESFAAGVVTGNDVMGAQTAWMSAKSEVIDAGIELRLNHLLLQQALGK